jgi:hypothetical protein
VLNNPANLIDPSGNVPILIPLLIIGGGGLVNAGFDAFQGKIKSGGDFAKSFAVGAASTGAGLLTANPVAAGALGGAVGSITDSALTCGSRC